MAANKIAPNGGWSWYQSPSPLYSAADGAIYLQAMSRDTVTLSNNGSVWIYAVYPGLTVLGFSLHSALETDDHDCGAVLRLPSGSLLAAYGKHATTGQYRRISTNPADITAWGAEGSLGTAATTFANLWQSADTASTIWNFVQYNNGAAQDIRYQTSTDGGATWSGYTALWAQASGNQSLCRYAPNGANRLDFLVSDGHPKLNACSLYHFYMTVASNGTPSFFNSAGTSLGAPSFSSATAGVTRVYDGSTTCSMPWDLQIIGDVPTVAFAIYPDAAGAIITTTTGARQQYYYGQYAGGSWTTGLVADAGTAWNTGATRQDWLTSGDVSYSPGICLDPGDPNTVYLSRTNGGTSGTGATDCRLEKWQYSGGSWAKSADVSGATSSLNIRPFAVLGLAPTTILYWQAPSYGPYFPAGGKPTVWAYPAISFPTAKSGSPTWTPKLAPAGMQAYWLLHEGGGTSTRELVGGSSCPFIGTPTWGANALGPTLSGFSASIAVNADGASSALAAAANSTAGYPRYIWCVFSNTNTTLSQYMLQFGNSTSTQDMWCLGVNSGSSGNVFGQLRDHAGGSALITATTTAATDGALHVLCIYSASASSHARWLDGVSVATSSTAVGTYTFQNMTLGAIRRNGTQSNPFLGSVTAAGWGLGSPDPGLLYDDLINGRFGGTRGFVQPFSPWIFGDQVESSAMG